MDKQTKVCLPTRSQLDRKGQGDQTPTLPTTLITVTPHHHGMIITNTKKSVITHELT